VPEPAETTEPDLRSADGTRDRYAAVDSLGWWQRAKVSHASVLVVGAGAVGNEVIKNLALAGVGRLLIVDCDTVEAANLSRSVLFREADRGRGKAEVAARAAREMNPDVEAIGLRCDVTRDLGAGAFRRVDVVVSCVDSREARLAINRACYRVGKPWVDGALGEMAGEARVFWPGRGACYECTLVAADYQAMNARYSCSSLARDPVAAGRVAGTPAGAAILGGIEAQEALKLVHGLPVEPGKGVVWSGLSNESYTVTYAVREDCASHQVCSPILECPELAAGTVTVAGLLALVREAMGEEAEVELDFDLLVRFECVHGHASPPIARPLSQVHESAAACPVCGTVRWPRQTYRLRGTEEFRDQTLAEIGIAPLALLCGRAGGERRYFELTGDASRLFGGHPARGSKESHG
jgi:molybdopterin/thiamine biosynthesis adenylyltransferase